MNGWRVVGYFFLCLGALFLVVGLVAGFEASYLLSEVYPQIFGPVFLPYAVICAVMFILGALAFYVGAPITVSHPPAYEQQRYSTSSSPSIDQSNPPTPKEAVCPSCGKNMIFIQQYQRWYCPNEKKYI